MTARDAALLGIILLGSVLRLVPVVGDVFPLNDGALFLTMARDLAANGMVPPTFTSYNDLRVPFAYPPDGMYLIALLEAVGLNGIDVLRWVPALASIATIPVVYAIGRLVFRSDGMGLATAALFAVNTGSYEWLVLGGGITRAPGFLLALLAVLFAVRAYRDGGWHWLGAAGLAAGTTGLWHPQATVFAGLSVMLLMPLVTPDWRVGLRRLATIGGIGVLVVLPWLAVVVARHGIDPLWSAVGSGGSPLVGLVTVMASRTSAGHLEVLGIATTFGLVVSAARRFWLPVVWLLVIAAVDSRAGQPYISVPAALAIAFALRDMGSVLERQLSRHRAASSDAARQWSRAPIVIGLVLLVAAFADSLAAQGSADTPLRAVPRAERHAMEWVVANTEPGDAFVVVSGRFWAWDATSEWFPLLAQRRSAATVQGYEWLGVQAYERQVERAAELAPCVAADDLECVDRWLDGAGDVEYLFLARSPDAVAAGVECCLQLAEQVAQIRTAEVVYRDDDVVIVRLGQEAT